MGAHHVESDGTRRHVLVLLPICTRNSNMVEEVHYTAPDHTILG